MGRKVRSYVIELVPMAGTLIEVALAGTLMVEGMTGTKAEMAMGDTKGQLEIKAEEGTARGSKRMIIVIVANIRIGDTCHSRKLKLFFLTHDDERAPAAAASEEREKSVWALRRIDPQTGHQRLDSLVLNSRRRGTAASQLSAEFHCASAKLRWRCLPMLPPR